MLENKNEKQGAVGGVIGTLLLGWLVPTVAGAAIWGYGSAEKDKKWRSVGKGVLLGTGATVAVEIVLALIIVSIMPATSGEYQTAVALLAKNGIKVPPKTVT